jgi:hypothetical protein
MLCCRCIVLGLSVLTSSLLSGCGTYVPQVQEFWEGVDITGDMELRIKQNIFCETVRALRYVRQHIRSNVNGVNQPSIPDSFGVQMQVNLTVDEVGALNPSVGYNEVLPNVLRDGVSVPQSFALNGSGTLSSDATRTDTWYSYYNVGKLTRPGANAFCDEPQDLHGSSPLLKADLEIQDYLMVAVPGADVFSSSAPAAGGVGKSAKLDVYSYEIKFVVVSNGSINPVWKLVNVSTGNGTLPLVNAGRTRTHDLILTFGPGTDTPALFAQQAHFTGQIVQSNRQRRGTQ